MKSELAPVCKAFELTRSDERADGSVGDIEIVAMLTGIGMVPAKAAAERALATDPDHVMICGIAGGIDPSLGIGDMIWPAVVVDKHGGTEHTPSPLPGITPNGRLVSSDDFTVTDEDIAALRADGVIAVDMETGAIAAACDAAGVPWTAFRAISDRAGETPTAVLGLANPDGSANVKNVAKFLVTKPHKIGLLGKLAKGAQAAATNAATTARAHCTNVVMKDRTS